MFAKESIEVTQRSDFMSPQVSTIWLELNTEGGKKTFLCGLYREFNDRAGSGQMTPDEQAEVFKIITNQIKMACKEGRVICIGDWNLDLLKMDKENYYLRKTAEEFKSCVASCGMKQLDFGITFQRIHQDGKVIQGALDHVILNSPEMVNDYVKLEKLWDNP